MKKGLMLFTVVLALLMTLSLAGCGGDKGTEKNPEDLPGAEMMLPIKDTALAEVKAIAEKLDESKWGDKHAALMDSGEGADYKDFDKMREELFKLGKETKATYYYALYPDKEKVFIVTVDGSEDPDDFGAKWWPEGPGDEQYEEAMLVAWDGTPAASGGTYWGDQNPDGSWQAFWPAYAPIHNSDGEVVALIAVDISADESNDYPEWDYDDEEGKFAGPDYFTE